MQRWLARHAQALVSTLGLLWRQRGATALTAAVMGISLALPVGLLIGLENLRTLGSHMDTTPRISVYLDIELPDAQAAALAAELRQRPEVAAVQHITRAEALESFSARSELGSALELLGDNPLPGVLVLDLATTHRAPEHAAALADDLRALPQSDLVRYDREWVERLHALLRLGRQLVWLVLGLLSAGVVLIMTHSIRTAILSRREEIEISKLVGATDTFIRRPFLYWGLLQGLAGGVVAVVLVLTGHLALADPVASLAGVYGSETQLGGVGLGRLAGLPAGAALLGWAGAWLAVADNLRRIEP